MQVQETHHWYGQPQRQDFFPFFFWGIYNVQMHQQFVPISKLNWMQVSTSTGQTVLHISADFQAPKEEPPPKGIMKDTHTFTHTFTHYKYLARFIFGFSPMIVGLDPWVVPQKIHQAVSPAGRRLRPSGTFGSFAGRCCGKGWCPRWAESWESGDGPKVFFFF